MHLNTSVQNSNSPFFNLYRIIIIKILNRLARHFHWHTQRVITRWRREKRAPRSRPWKYPGDPETLIKLPYLYVPTYLPTPFTRRVAFFEAARPPSVHCTTRALLLLHLAPSYHGVFISSRSASRNLWKCMSALSAMYTHKRELAPAGPRDAKLIMYINTYDIHTRGCARELEVGN